MGLHRIMIEKLYSKGVSDRRVGGKFIVVKPYQTLTYYAYLRLKPFLIYVYCNHKLIGLAYIESVEKIFTEDISQDELVVPKEEFIRSLKCKRATKVTLRWVEVFKTKNKKVFI